MSGALGYATKFGVWCFCAGSGVIAVSASLAGHAPWYISAAWAAGALAMAALAAEQWFYLRAALSSPRSDTREAG